MDYELVELKSFNGNAGTVYSILEKGKDKTLYGQFVMTVSENYRDAVKYISGTIKLMNKESGFKLNYFKPNEGNYGDRVCVLMDIPERRVRLYCMRVSEKILILGGGNGKLAGLTSYQGDPKLDAEAVIMKDFSKDLNEWFFNKTIRFNENKDKLIGKLKNYE